MQERLGMSEEMIVAGLFVDFENIFYRLLAEPHRLQRAAAVDAAMDALNGLRSSLREHDYALVVERCYADWERMPPTTQRQLQIAGVLPRFVDSRVGKNSADIELSLDVQHQVLTRTELQHIILIGGDRDYLPILRRLKEQHRSIQVCAFTSTLAGDVREFAAHYARATITELDGFVDFAKYGAPAVSSGPADEALAPPAVPTDPASLLAPAPANSTATESEPETRGTSVSAASPPEVTDWHEQYMQALVRFMKLHSYREIHLGPFFRWLRAEGDLDHLSVSEQRSAFDGLKRMEAVIVEDRDTGQGYSFSAARLNWNHPLVQRLWED